MKFKYGEPAYKIRTRRLVLKCWDPAYARELDAAIKGTVDSLLPWLPWAAYEPLSVRARVALLRKFRSEFDRDEDYVYGIFDPAERQVIGSTGLHTRIGPLGYEIGYWINAAHQNRGYATEAANALIRTGFELTDIDRIEIRCDEKNTKSLRVIEKLGVRHECTLRRRQIDADGAFQDLMLFVIFREDFERASRSGRNLGGPPVEYYSAVGDRMGPGVPRR